MRLQVIISLCLVASKAIMAGYTNGAYVVGRIFSQNNIVFFGLKSYSIPQGTKTCDFYGTQFKFDATSPNGKVFYSTLLQAQATGQPVDVWFFDDRPAVATNCEPDNVANIYGVGLSR